MESSFFDDNLEAYNSANYSNPPPEYNADKH